jgi:hypothetical protein
MGRGSARPGRRSSVVLRSAGAGHPGPAALIPTGSRPPQAPATGCDHRRDAVKLNHVNLTVDDVPAARRFLERHLGMRRHGERWAALRPVHRPPP